jgi:hypothetical protein
LTAESLKITPRGCFVSIFSDIENESSSGGVDPIQIHSFSSMATSISYQHPKMKQQNIQL